jgi:hypothetical protein
MATIDSLAQDGESWNCFSRQFPDAAALFIAILQQSVRKPTPEPYAISCEEEFERSGIKEMIRGQFELIPRSGNVSPELEEVFRRQRETAISGAIGRAYIQFIENCARGVIVKM